jgi:hypothetical protein
MVEHITRFPKFIDVFIHAGKPGGSKPNVIRERAVAERLVAKSGYYEEARKLVDFVQSPNESAAWFRNILFIQYIGGSIASALVNATQTVTMTAP